MRLSAVTLAIVLLTNNIGADAFRVTPDGGNNNNDIMKKSVEDAILTEIKPLHTTGGGIVDLAPPVRNKILGTEVPSKWEYWERPDIHTFGNIGWGGAVHAAMAPLATKLIDEKAYGGVDVRKNIARELHTLVNKTGARVVDMCCGVGMSTRALESAFHDAEFLVGVDTSQEMISMAKAISDHEQAIRDAMSRHTVAVRSWLKKEFKLAVEAMSVVDTNPYPSSRTGPQALQASYRLGNAENTKLPNLSFDLVTIMYGFHEVPLDGRARIIHEARRLLRKGGHLAIVDICPTYEPSAPMLAGEPFVREYQQNIENQLASLRGFTFSKRKVIVPGHVNMWLLTAA